ncbi:hypothetical protein [Tomitella gaofuii]|uniref:hypothetical protein n=1 Tax=Tomitella gaofuii TaxID=2760083 RepID=UPI0027E4DB32|nr:hypothetical protein [Tomitella gaofuii]
MSLAATQGAVVLADWGNKDLTGGRGAEFGKASPLGLLLILALLVGIVFLMRSMNRQLKKVPKSFDDDDDQRGAGDGGESGGGAGGGPDGGDPDGGGAVGPDGKPAGDGTGPAGGPGRPGA